ATPKRRATPPRSSWSSCCRCSSPSPERRTDVRPPRPAASHRKAPLVLLGLTCLLWGSCRTGDVDRQPFVVLVQAKANDFRPVEGLVVATAGGAELARTNSDGRALF